MRVVYAHHDSLALVLDDVTRAADFVTTAETEEHELIRRVYRVIVLWRHRRCLSLCRHDCKAIGASALVRAI